MREDSFSKQIKLKSIENEAFQEFLLELLKGKKWILSYSYNPNKNILSQNSRWPEQKI